MATIWDLMMKVYPPDNYRRWKKGFVWPTGVSTDSKNSYLLSALTLITSFLGIPNRPMSNPPKQSLANIARNLIGWQANASLGRQIFNGIKAVPQLILNLVLIPFKLALNIARIGTELLPAIACYLSSNAAEKARAGWDNSTGWSAVGWAVLFGATELSLELSRVLYFIGGAVTSPIASAGKKWDLRREFGNEHAKETRQGKWLGGLRTILSITISIVFWTAVIVAAAPALAAVLSAYAPAAIVPALKAMVGALAWVGSHAVLPAVGYLGISTSSFSPVIAGLSLLTATASLMILTMGVSVSKAYESLLSWWHTTSISASSRAKEFDSRAGGPPCPLITPALSTLVREPSPDEPKSPYSKTEEALKKKALEKESASSEPRLSEEFNISDLDESSLDVSSEPNNTGGSLSLSTSSSY